MDDAAPDTAADRYRSELDALRAAGLSEDEADLIARRRIGTSGATADGLGTAVVLAVAAGAAVHAVRLAAGAADLDDGWLLRHASLLLVPALVALLGLRRRVESRTWLRLGGAILAVALAAGAVPHRPGSDTELLAALHLPVLAWAVVLVAHAGGRARDLARRTEAVRFSGEVAVLYVLLALGGGVLVGLTGGLLAGVGVDAEPVAEWVLPAGAAGAVVVAGWLVETRPRIAGGLAPLLAQVFTPLFAAMLLGVAAVYAVGARAGGFDRDLVALLDVLLVVVLGLATFGQAARGGRARVGWDDRLRLAAVVAALLLDVGVLTAMLGRLTELGATPNRIAALGLNVVLLVALGGTLRHLGAAVLRRGPMVAVERWQAGVLPLLVAWAAFVAVLLPPLASFA